MSDETSALLAYWLPQAEQGDAAACYNVGVILQNQGNDQAAIGYYEKSIRLNPNLAEAYNNLGGIYKTKNDLDKALHYYLAALKLNPHSANINNNVGVVLKDQQFFMEAAHFFNQAIYVDPTNAVAYYNLGMLYENQRRLKEASDYFHKAFALDPSLTVAHWSAQMTHIQALCLAQKNSAIAVDKLKALSVWVNEHHVDGEAVVGFSIPFYLTYQESNNRELLSVCGDMCVSLMQHLQREVFPLTEHRDKIKVGFVSDHFHNHSVWHAVLKGWYKYLDKNKFEIISFCLDKNKDADYDLAKRLSDHFIDHGQNTQQWRDLILAQQVDVLIFPAIGTDLTVHQLACLRMSPVQITSWGHPETCGFPTIDYYLSGEDFEPPHAPENYRETLVTLPGLGSCYEPLQMQEVDPHLEELGITNETRILIAPGKSFKYAQEYDSVFPDIAVRVKNVKIIFFKSKPDGLTDELQQRVIKAFADKQLNANDYVIFTPLFERSRFHALMKKSHVYLDTIGFSGFNTAMQSIECGLPIVTYEGRFMRGRFGSAILRRLGLEELIAHTPRDYIEKAIQLANDDSYRENIKRKMVSAAPALYSDVSVVRALEAFIMSVVNR